MFLKKFFTTLILTVVSIALPGATAQETVSNKYFSLKFNSMGITSLKHSHDTYNTDYIMEGEILGDVLVRYRTANGRWQETAAARIAPSSRRTEKGAKNVPPQYVVTYDVSKRYDWGEDLEFSVGFGLEGNALIWTLHFRNLTDEPMEIGDIALPLLFNTRKGWDRVVTDTKRVITHSFISGHGSFLYWMRPNSVGPYLVMMPLVKCPSFESEDSFRPTKLEYYERQGREAYSVFIHSAVSGAIVGERGGSWRQPHTSITLTPKFTPGYEVTYGFKFRWADGYDGIRDILYEEGLLDVHVVPGMTVPEDLEAMVSLRTKSAIESVTPEHPEETRIEYLGEKAKDSHVYRVKFSRLGENLLRVKWGKGQEMVLEFFVTEPLETLIRKRAAFLANKQLIRDPDKWYDGLVSDWDMKNKVLRTPDNVDDNPLDARSRGGFSGMEDILTSGDPMNCKAPYIAAKNAHFPSQEEIEAVDYHLKNFVWDKQQLTDKEGPHPYGIYIQPNWKINRESRNSNRPGHWKEQLYRAYDYPHYVMLYLNMYRVAKYYPELKTELDTEEYLKRAFGTARAYFTLPYKRDPLIHALWVNMPSAQTTGMYNELVIVDLIEELYANGKKEEADWLKGEWEKKVEYFVNEDPNLWCSEFAFDPTGFESTHALAKYAMEHANKPGTSLDVRYEDVVRFMEKQTKANIATRGWLENSYYLLGGSGALRYMSQMAGWSILDYGLYYAKDPEKYLCLGYASYLSSWALMNTGTPESNYGYWYPGKENDGGAGSAFVMQPFGRTWFGKAQARGAWAYGGEIDLGFGAALRTAATVVVDDPLYGLFAYGGQLTKDRSTVNVIPKDGLRERFHIIRGEQRFHMLLSRDGFAKDKPIVLNESLNEIRFTLESRSSREHTTELRVSGLPAGTYEVTTDDLSILTFTPGKGKENIIALPVGEKKEIAVVIRRIKG